MFPKTDAKAATKAATVMIGCYPNGKPADPQTYIAAVTALLAEYPIEIVQRVTSPATGIVLTCRFMPSLAELSDALETAMEPLRRRWREAKQEREEAERRARPPALPDAAARERVAQEAKKLSESLRAAPDPVPFNRDGTKPVGTSAADAVARVLAYSDRKLFKEVESPSHPLEGE